MFEHITDGQGGRWAQSPVLDLNYTHFAHNLKGLAVIGTWYFGSDNVPEQPCLVILRNDVPVTQQRPCVVTLGTKFLWDEDNYVGNEEHVHQAAADFCVILDLDPLSNRDRFRVIDAVRLRLRDVQDIPPAPERRKTHIGEATITVSDGRSFERDIEV